jgi:hypothetical protein
VIITMIFGAGTAIIWLSRLSHNITRIFRHVKGGSILSRLFTLPHD